MIPVYFVQIAFQQTELFHIEIDTLINLLVTLEHGPEDWNSKLY